MYVKLRFYKRNGIDAIAAAGEIPQILKLLSYLACNCSHSNGFADKMKINVNCLLEWPNIDFVLCFALCF